MSETFGQIFALQRIAGKTKLVELPVAELKGVKLLGVTICAVLLPILLLSLFPILAQVFLQRKCLRHRSG